jgi:hypothetical protein
MSTGMDGHAGQENGFVAAVSPSLWVLQSQSGPTGSDGPSGYRRRRRRRRRMRRRRRKG